MAAVPAVAAERDVDGCRHDADPLHPRDGSQPAARPRWRPSPADADPPHDCPRCPRLVAYRAANRAAHPDWWNAPVPGWGDPDAWLAIVGLAPGVTGANRTGRPFTGDHAGLLLYATLAKFGLSRGNVRRARRRRADG